MVPDAGEDRWANHPLGQRCPRDRSAGYLTDKTPTPSPNTFGFRGYSAQEHYIVIVTIACYVALTPSANTYTASRVNRSTVPYYSL